MIALSNAVLRVAIRRRGWPEPVAGALSIFGIRGAAPAAAAVLRHTTQTLGEWDDTIGVFGTDFRLWRATTDPGDYYTRRPLNPIGAARLEPGAYSYRRGLHRGIVPALVQAGPVRVSRDANRDGQAQTWEPRFSGLFGINIHPGRGSKIGRWSAGCQVIPQPGWADFWRIVTSRPQAIYRYYLLEADDLR